MDSSIQDDSYQEQKPKKKKSLDDYQFITNENGKNDLGKGAYGTVKKVVEKETGKIYAMKIMNKKALFEYSTKENLRREIQIQKNINHPHITRLFTFFEDKENVYLILELAEKGSLFHTLRKRRKFSENEAFVYFFQTCLGIDYLHKRKIIHRDLKPENLLLDKDGNIKLCDFGWSAENQNKRSTFCGTIDYMAPEMVKNLPYDHRLDIWCLGVLLYEMLHGFAPFKGRSDQEKTLNIAKNASIDFNKNLSPEGVDLIRNILKPAPVDRLSMEEIFNHPWMKKIEKFYNIDIQSYIEKQDEHIQNSSGGSKKENSKTSSKQNLEERMKPQKQESTESKSSKIITIIDNSTPLNMKGKQFDFNESEGSSTKASSNQSDSDKLFKKHDTNQRSKNKIIYENESNSQENIYRQWKNKGLQYTLQGDDQKLRKQKSPEFGRSENQEKSKNAFQDPELMSAMPKRLRRNHTDIHDYDDDIGGDGNNVVPHFGGQQKNYRKQKSMEKKYPSKKNNDFKQNRNKKMFLQVDEEDDELEPNRLSRISKRNVQFEENIKKKEPPKEEPGFFDKILLGLGCVLRDQEKK